MLYGNTELKSVIVNLAILKMDSMMHVRKAKVLIERLKRLEKDVKALKENKP